VRGTVEGGMDWGTIIVLLGGTQIKELKEGGGERGLGGRGFLKRTSSGLHELRTKGGTLGKESELRPSKKMQNSKGTSQRKEVLAEGDVRENRLKID